MAPRSTRRADMALQGRLAEHWVDRQRSANTKAAYRSEFARFDSWCQAHGTIALRADVDVIGEYAAARQAAGDGPATLRRRWSAISSFFDFAIEHRAVRTNPVGGIARPRATSGNPSTTLQLTPQAVAVYRTIATALDPRLDLLVALLVADGLKLAEALALDIGDVHGKPPKVSLTIRRRDTPTRIWLDPDSGRAIYRCVGIRRDGPLFISSSTTRGEPRRLTRFGADHLIRQLSRNEEQRVTSNELRRYHITHSHHSSGDLTDVRDRAGLAHIRSVRRYLIDAEPGTDD